MTTLSLPYRTTAAGRRKPRLALWKRFINAIVAPRIDAAERELRRHEALWRETALLHGEFRRHRLNKAELLPFTL
jgi:hypothetical protein